MATEVQTERAASHAISAPHGTTALAGLAATAGAIHLIATAEHVGADWELGLFFALVGAAQLLAAWRIHRDGLDPRLLMIVALAGVGLALLWAFSRTTGIPFGPEQGVAKVGVGDTIATLLELGFAGLAGLILRRGEQSAAWLDDGLGVRLTFALLSLSLMLAAVGGHEH